MLSIILQFLLSKTSFISLDETLICIAPTVLGPSVHLARISSLLYFNGEVKETPRSLSEEGV